jgi:flagellar hook-basal body complex protein FliE
MLPIAPLSSASQVASAYGNTATSSAGAPATDFSSMVGEAAESALDTLKTSEQVATAGVTGGADVQQVVQALSDAELTMQTVVAVRDKVLGAYNDIMKMTI